MKILLFTLEIFIFQTVNSYNVEFNSIDEYDNFLPNSGGYFSFSVKARSAITIALVSDPSNSHPMYQIGIGLNDNTKSYILDHNGHILVEQDHIIDYLDETEFRRFWVQWYHTTGNVQGVIIVGEIDCGPFLNYTEPEAFPILYAGFKSDYLASWIVESQYRWVSNKQTIANPFMGGQGNAPLYVIRARVGGHVIPGVLGLGHPGYVVDSSNRAVQVAEYEILTDLANGTWVESYGSYIPPFAIIGGYTSSGENLYIGRMLYKSSLVIGKIVPSLGALLFYDGGVVYTNSVGHEILVQN